MIKACLSVVIGFVAAFVMIVVFNFDIISWEYLVGNILVLAITGLILNG